ncbi:hypothetical protein PT974_08509 [Cladobotryum mycophilum]|uniref:LRR-containing protein second PH domain-containing protein n=1 Tax=Cladobotryum mycophilum TaxID=491253 RepID=A0ABR0SDK0_9HYPO
MNTERWKWRSSTASSIGIGSAASNHYAPLKSESPEPTTESKKPRTLTRALRSLSNSSLDSMSGAPPRNQSSSRKLQKTSSGSGSVIERIQRRVSRDSSVSNSPSECPSSPSELPFASMEIVRYGCLKTDVSILKARSEYLVLTDHSLVKLGSAEAARGVFPQLGHMDGQSKGNTSPHPMNSKSAAADIRFEVPLRSIVAVFNEESSASRSGIEVWWFSQPPKLAYCRAHLYFALPKERNDWLAAIQQAYKVRLRKNPINSIIPENLKIRVNHAVQIAETPTDSGPQQLIFPVAKRTLGAAQKGASVDDTQDQTDSSSFYLAIGPYLCYFIEVLKADYTSLPGELRIKSITFGTVTLTRFRASVASHEQRFSISFRSPFGRENRLDLASTFYRRIIEALTKVDRILKPMWPQNLQQAIFQIKGLPPPLQLTSGNDLGGLEMSLQAYCVAFNVPVPSWTIEWNNPSQPAFRLLPSDGPEYSPLQLLAVFRALRYNSFFKAISFRDVDLSSLAGKKDHSQYGDCVVFTSLSGVRIPEEYYEILLHCTVLEQEIHALMFASESIRSVDFTRQPIRGQGNSANLKLVSSEMMSPILMLLRRQLCHCHSISVSGNLLAPTDVDELANLLVLDETYIKKLELSNCGFADAGLTKLWTALVGQAETLEWLDTSDNQGTVRFEIIRDSLAQFRHIKKLIISGNTRLESEESLFVQSAINSWPLQELNLSGIVLNDATVDVIAGYLEMDASADLQVINLNNCRITGNQIARLFRSMGQARQLTMHMNANRLDEGIDDLCRSIACGFGPWSLFMQMTEFYQEANYVKLLRALTVNKTIECLSLAGTATSDALSSAACHAASEFFAKNDTVRFLDISGYVSKLDEGRLGREFSRALSGMRTNSRIEHLRVRSQMLNINIGDLAEAISGNKTLHTLDCEGNNFNLSNFWHLVKHIECNRTIRHFSAFSEHELAQTIQKSVDNAGPVPASSRRSSVIAKFRHDKGHFSVEKPLGQRLQDEWESAINALHQVLERNQRIFQEGDRPGDSLADDDGIGEVVFSVAFGGLASRAYESRKATSGSSQRSPTPISKASMKNLQGGMPNSQTPSDEPTGGVLRSYSTVSSNTSSSGHGSIDSGMPTPPEMDSPEEKDLDWGHSPNSETFYDDLQDDTYYYIDDDAGLQMGRYRRFLGDPTSRIEEEDDKVEAEKEFT